MTSTTLLFKAEFPTTEQDVLEFAKLNGYTEIIQEPVYRTITETIDGVTTERQEQVSWNEIPNPKDAVEFIREFMTDYIADKLNMLNVKKAQDDLTTAQETYNTTVIAEKERVKSYLTVESI